LDHYAGFKRHLESRYERVAEDVDTGILFSLAGRPDAAGVPAETYDEALIRNVRAIAVSLLPAGTKVLVASGDGRFLDLGGPIGIRLGQSDGDVIEILAEGRARGAKYLLIPHTSDAWLDEHARLRDYAETVATLVTRQENVCTIYDITADPPQRKPARRPKPASRRARRKRD
jgi:hypothetical protein